MHAPTSIFQLPNRSELSLSIETFRLTRLGDIKLVISREKRVTSFQGMELDASVYSLTAETQLMASARTFFQGIDHCLARRSEPCFIVVELNVGGQKVSGCHHVTAVICRPER